MKQPQSHSWDIQSHPRHLQPRAFSAFFHHWAHTAVKGCVSQSQRDADINQAHLTCCLTYCSTRRVYLKGGALCFISSTHLRDCHQPFMFFSFALMAAYRSTAVAQPFVTAYYLLDVILQSHLQLLVGNSVETCDSSKHCFECLGIDKNLVG